MNERSKSGLALHLEKLASFAAVVRAGSFHAAASTTRISQPALSRAVMTLESAIGTKLFERSRSGVKVTPAGQQVFDFYERLRGDVANLEQKIRHPADPTAGVIQIGTFETFTFYLWPALLQGLRQTHPSLIVRLASDRESELRAKLLSGQVQLVVEAEPRVEELVRSVILYRDLFKVYESPDLKLKTAPILYVPGARAEDGQSLRDLLRSRNLLEEAPTYELDTFSGAQELALRGVGLAILPERLAAARVRAKELRPVNVAKLPSSGFGRHRICASFLEENAEDARVKLMMKRLRDFR